MRYRAGFEKAIIFLFLISNILIFQNCGQATGFDAVEAAVSGGQDQSSTSAPLVNLGSDKTYSGSASSSIISGNSLTITAEIQNAGEAPVFSWTQVSGPTQLSFSTKAQIPTVVRNLTYGTYEIQLQMTTASKTTAKDSLRFTLVAPSSGGTTTTTTTITTTTTTLPVTTTTKPPVTTTTVKPGTPTTVTTSTTTSTTTTTVPPSSNKTPVVTLSATKVMIARPARTGPSPSDPVAMGGDFSFQGIVVDDGEVKSCQWKQISGPSTVTLKKQFLNEDLSNSLIPGNRAYYCGLVIAGFTYGEYVFQADATDANGKVGSDQVKLIFPKYSGLNVGPQLASGCPTGECVVSPGYSKSVDDGVQNGGLAGYGIDSGLYVDKLRDFGIKQISGPSTARISYISTLYGSLSAYLSHFTYGSYEFEFYLVDSENRKVTERVRYTFVRPQTGSFLAGTSPAVNPQVISDRHGDVVFAGNEIPNLNRAFDVHVYYSSKPANYDWKQISGPTTLNFKYKNQTNGFLSTAADNWTYGTYVFEASLNDEKGNAKTEILKITHPNPNIPANPKQPPVVTLSAGKAITVRPTCYTTGPVNQVETGKEFSFQGVVYDDGEIATARWTQVSGPTTLNLNPYHVSDPYYGMKFTGHTYGTYELRLEVTDTQGNTGSDSIKITFPRGL